MLKELIELYNQGYMYKDIAQKLGKHVLVVMRKIYILQLLGILKPRMVEKLKKYIPPELVKKLYIEGKTYDEIAKTLGIDRRMTIDILVTLHQLGMLPYRIPIHEPHKLNPEILGKVIDSNKVLTRLDFVDSLRKAGIEISYTDARYMLDKLCKEGTLRKIDIRRLRKFIKRNFPIVIYYKDEDALAEYLIKHMKNVKNKKSLIQKLNYTKLPPQVRETILREVVND
jgi:transposase